MFRRYGGPGMHSIGGIPLVNSLGSGGNPPAWSVVFNGINTSINCGSDASLDDLPDFAVAGKGQITIDGWICATSFGSLSIAEIVSKSGSLQFFIASLGGPPYDGLCGQFGGTTNANSSSGLDDFTADGSWHHILGTYDETGGATPVARTIYLAVDGVWVSYTSQLASLGNYGGDSGSSLLLGAGIGTFFDGAMGWMRVSNSVRYDPAGGNFIPPARNAPPATDGNTMGLWKMDEGTGVIAADSSGNGNDGTIANGTWSQA